MASEFHWISIVFWFFFTVTLTDGRRSAVPDEQRLYNDLMDNYESSVRPVLNASSTVLVHFKLTLNQIVDLDERTQVLTTNVFIDQEWPDENLRWDPLDYNGIKTLRVPAQYVWRPDTFIFNNADDGSTGFMQGVYVLVKSNGTILWPVPVKLKSSCRVDIRYFPFDDQTCMLRFGSWIYSGNWIDFSSSRDKVDLKNYIDNSEWDLVGVTFTKSIRGYACCSDPHPDLTFTLSMRRRTFYYIFNIIVPCIMLSVLTLLTFWLPCTSGEKISLGLSVFLAFSMFMLLIAEEVPATSESVPLIGIYLTTVMTMTSLSVIMAVLVINLYNRGNKHRRAPGWLKTLILDWICRLLCMRHDIEMLAQTIRLEEDDEMRHRCAKHSKPKSAFNNMKLRDEGYMPICSKAPQGEPEEDYERNSLSRRFSQLNQEKTAAPEELEPIWQRRNTLIAQEREASAKKLASDMAAEKAEKAKKEKEKKAPKPTMKQRWKKVFSTSQPAHKNDTIAKLVVAICQKELALSDRKEMVVEWQTIATVIDRLLFWIFLLGTVTTYLVILIWVPYSKPETGNDLTVAHKMAARWSS